MANKGIDLLGLRFGKLTVRARLDMTPSGARWLCECDCGQTAAKVTTQLRRKRGSTCGCRACEFAARSVAKSTHGFSHKEHLYGVWKSMRDRCANKDNPYYGGKGITVCAEWASYPVFRAWALASGYTHNAEVSRADRLSIERINPGVGYCPENCEWITGRENTRRMATGYQPA